MSLLRLTAIIRSAIHGRAARKSRRHRVIGCGRLNRVGGSNHSDHWHVQARSAVDRTAVLTHCAECKATTGGQFAYG
jgi:hypothetical protein